MRDSEKLLLCNSLQRVEQQLRTQLLEFLSGGDAPRTKLCAALRCCERAQALLAEYETLALDSNAKQAFCFLQRELACVAWIVQHPAVLGPACELDETTLERVLQFVAELDAFSAAAGCAARNRARGALRG